MTIPENPLFDHRTCPHCGALMRLALVEPRRIDRDESFEVHIYRCDVCSNTSRFVFATPSDAG